MGVFDNIDKETKDKIKDKVVEKGKEVLKDKGKELLGKAKESAKESTDRGEESTDSSEDETQTSPEAKDERELTPEEIRESKAMVLQIALYPDGQLNIKPVQNINSRAMAEYMITRAKDDYLKADVSNLTAMRVVDLILQSKDKKKKGEGLWIPGLGKK